MDKVRITIFLSPEGARALKIAALNSGGSVSEYVEAMAGVDFGAYKTEVMDKTPLGTIEVVDAVYGNEKPKVLMPKIDHEHRLDTKGWDGEVAAPLKTKKDVNKFLKGVSKGGWCPHGIALGGRCNPCGGVAK